MNLKIPITLTAIVGMLVYAGCKPKPVTGQIFIVDQSGVGLPLGGVQILLVDGKEADDFIKRREAEAPEQLAKMKSDMESLKSQLTLAQSECLRIMATNKAFFDSRSYTNDPRYVALVNESENGAKTVETLSKAVDFLNKKYGQPPFGVFNGVYKGATQEQRDAWEAERQDMQKIQPLRQRASQIDSELNNLTEKIFNERLKETTDAQWKVGQIEEDLKAKAASMNWPQTADFYLADFSPTPSEKCLADLDGNFTIQNPRPRTKIFAKLKPEDSTNGFFWLVELPPRGKKLILSNDNRFSAPTSFP